MSTPNKYAPSASIRGDVLVLSLPDAVTPVVWQFDLSSVKASALEVNANDANAFALRLKTPRGEVHDIAVYASREQAIDILAIVHQALSANTNQSATSATPSASIAPKGNNWPLAASALIVLVTVFFLLGKIMPAPHSAGTTFDGSQTTLKSGVPMSADDVLNGGQP